MAPMGMYWLDVRASHKNLPFASRAEHSVSVQDGPLVQVNQVNVKTESFRRLVEKYGTTEIYDRIVRICAEGES